MALKSRPKAGFVYKPRTVDQVKDRVARKSSRFDSIFKPGFDSFRLKQGDNLFRYLPPTWDDADHYGYTIFVHYGVGPDNSSYLCPRKMLNKPCPVCEAAKDAKDAGETEEAKELQPAERIVSWVLDRDADDPEKPLLFEQSWTQDRDITALCVNERTGEILMVDHPDKGYDVTVKRQGTGPRKTKYFGQSIARDDSPIHDSERMQDEILDYVKENPVPDTLNFFDYDYLKGMLSGTVAEKDEVLDKEVDEDAEPAPHRGPRRDQELDPEAEIEEERHPRRATVVKDEPRRVSARRQTEEEVDETPPPRRPVRRPEPVDEEVDEEAEEVVTRPARRSEPAPVSRSNGRPRVVEEVEEEEEAAPPPRGQRNTTVRR